MIRGERGQPSRVRDRAPGHPDIRTRPEKALVDHGHGQVKGRNYWTGFPVGSEGVVRRPANVRLGDGANGKVAGK